MSNSRGLTDLQLLTVRAEAVGLRVAGLRGVRVLRTPTTETFDVGSAVPRELVAALEAAYRRAPSPTDPTADPPVIAACQQLFEAAGWALQRCCSVVWVIQPDTAFTSDAPIRRSDQVVPGWMRRANPGNWHPTEWDELLDGRLGPWAMAIADHRIISICHTPVRLCDGFAECGVWTDPEFRGRGHAAAVTAAWAELFHGSKRRLFYSTDPDNRSSQRVTERLRLRFVGRHSSLEPPELPGDGLHPLSRARHLDENDR